MRSPYISQLLLAFALAFWGCHSERSERTCCLPFLLLFMTLTPIFVIRGLNETLARGDPRIY